MASVPISSTGITAVQFASLSNSTQAAVATITGVTWDAVNGFSCQISYAVSGDAIATRTTSFQYNPGSYSFNADELTARVRGTVFMDAVKVGLSLNPNNI